MNINLDKVKTNILVIIVCAGIIGALYLDLALLSDAKTQNQQKPKTEKVTETPVANTTINNTAQPIDTTVKKETKTTPEVLTVKDTAMVLYYFPRTYGRDSKLILTNKQGQRSSYTPNDIPVQRGDEIIYEMTKIKDQKYFKLIQNITMDKLEKEYMNKR